jgi:hypothetical protein
MTSTITVKEETKETRTVTVDPPIPTTRQLLLSRLTETCDRPEPQPPFPQAPEVGPPHLPAPTPATTIQLITPAVTA